VSRDDDHDHAHREDQNVGVLVHHVDEVGRVERQAARDDLEEDDDDDERAEDADLATGTGGSAEHLSEIAEVESAVLRGFGGSAHETVTFCFADVMLFRRDSGVASAAGILAVIAPSKIV
jgi:hypothetical protein